VAALSGWTTRFENKARSVLVEVPGRRLTIDSPRYRAKPLAGFCDDTAA